MRKESDDSPSNSGPHVELDLEIGIWEEFGSKTGIRHHHCVLVFPAPGVAWFGLFGGCAFPCGVATCSRTLFRDFVMMRQESGCVLQA